LAAGATATHEMFLAYVGAGFSEGQALRLLGETLAATLRHKQE
jgi:hypothetical protein